MASKLEQLRKINAQKKALLEEQRALREELDANKEERKEARKAQAQARKDVKDQKAKVRDLAASIYTQFSKAEPAEIETLADEIMEAATELAGTVRKFAEAAKVDHVVDEAETEDDEL